MTGKATDFGSGSAAAAKATAHSKAPNPVEGRIEDLVQMGQFAQAIALIDSLGSAKARS